MLSASPSQRNAGFSKALEILRTQSLSHPDKADISANAFDEFQVTLKWLTTSAEGGMMWGYWRTKVSENA